MKIKKTKEGMIFVLESIVKENVVSEEKPVCVVDGELVSLAKKDDKNYCFQHFYVGNHCPYLRIKDKKQTCNYYKS